MSKNRDKPQDVVRQQERQQSGRGGITVSATNYSGPLPPPEVLKQYEEALPGSAERIMAAFEAESNHRREIERAQTKMADYAIPHELADRRAGLWLAFIVSICGFALAGYAIYRGHPVGGVTAMIAEVAALAGVFVAGRTIQGHRETKDDKQLTT